MISPLLDISVMPSLVLLMVEPDRLIAERVVMLLVSPVKNKLPDVELLKLALFSKAIPWPVLDVPIMLMPAPDWA